MRKREDMRGYWVQMGRPRWRGVRLLGEEVKAHGGLFFSQAIGFNVHSMRTSEGEADGIGFWMKKRLVAETSVDCKIGKMAAVLYCNRTPVAPHFNLEYYRLWKKRQR